MCNTECCDRGIEYDGQCYCDIGAFGNECENNLQGIYIAPYYSFFGVCLSGFFLILLLSLKQFISSLNSSKIPSYYSCYQYFNALLGSPKNYILILAIVLSCCKIIWLILDPLEVYRGRQIVIERILAEIVYTILFFIYGNLLLVWYSLYDQISYNIYADKQKKGNRKFIFKYYKLIMRIRLFLVLLIQLTVSTLNGLRYGQKYKAFLMFCYIFLLCNFFCFIGEFLIYGKMLSKCIQDQIKFYNGQFKTQQLQVEDQQNERDFKQQSFQHQSPASKSPSPNFMQQQQQQKLHQQSPQKSDDIIEEQQDQVQDIQIIKQKTPLSKIKSVSFARTFIKRAHGSIFRQESQKQIKLPQQKQEQKTIKTESSNSDLDKIENDEKQQDELASCCLREEIPNLQWQDNSFEKKKVQDTIQTQITVIQEIKKKKMIEIEQKEQEKNIKQRTRADTKKLSYMSNSQQSIDIRTSYIYRTKQNSEDFQEKYAIKTSNLSLDKKILFKILLLVYIGIILEILFGGLSISVLTTDLIRDPIGALVYLYVSSALQFFSLITILKLFRDIKSQDIKNLMWIQTIGNSKNKINQQYIFSIPEQHKKDDYLKNEFEKRINMNIYNL